MALEEINLNVGRFNSNDPYSPNNGEYKQKKERLHQDILQRCHVLWNENKLNNV